MHAFISITFPKSVCIQAFFITLAFILPAFILPAFILPALIIFVSLSGNNVNNIYLS